MGASDHRFAGRRWCKTALFSSVAALLIGVSTVIGAAPAKVGTVDSIKDRSDDFYLRRVFVDAEKNEDIRSGAELYDGDHLVGYGMRAILQLCGKRLPWDTIDGERSQSIGPCPPSKDDPDGGDDVGSVLAQLEGAGEWQSVAQESQPPRRWRYWSLVEDFFNFGDSGDDLGNMNLDDDTRPVAPAPKFDWPLRAEVLSEFGAVRDGARNLGIDLGLAPGGTSGTVMASARGMVVVAGGPPEGALASLIIVQHRFGWRSVYITHGEPIVSKGQAVEPGQALTTLGETPDDTTLHFEIRKDLLAVDPEAYLPR